MQPIEIISRALKDIGALASGETPTADEAQDAFDMLNDLLDQWTNEDMMVFNVTEIIFPIVPGQVQYTIGGTTAATGTITLGQSTVSQMTNIQAGATASGSTKTVNIGTGGLAGSTTAITIGSTAGTSTTTLNGNVSFANTVTAPNLVASNGLIVNSKTVSASYSNGDTFLNGYITSTTTARVIVTLPTTMRTLPTSLEQNGTAANYGIMNGVTTVNGSSVPTFVGSGDANSVTCNFTVASGLTSGQGTMGRLVGVGSYLGFSAEL